MQEPRDSKSEDKSKSGVAELVSKLFVALDQSQGPQGPQGPCDVELLYYDFLDAARLRFKELKAGSIVYFHRTTRLLKNPETIPTWEIRLINTITFSDDDKKSQADITFQDAPGKEPTTYFNFPWSPK